MTGAEVYDAAIVRATVDNYASRAASFNDWADDASNASSARVARDAFAAALRDHFAQSDVLRVIDAGCGSGRDLEIFARAACLDAEGLEPCKPLARIAQSKAPTNKIHVTDFHTFFCKHDARKGEKLYHGVFAICSLFHVPRVELPPLLSAIRQCMVRGGVLLCSWPSNGDVDSQGRDGRWHNVMPLGMQRKMVEDAGFRIERADVSALSMYNGTWSLIVALA